MQATREQTQEYVLNLVADDYESLELITREVQAWAKEDGLEVPLKNLEDALAELIGRGLLGCFELSKTSGDFRECAADPGRADLWFRITAKGRGILGAT